MRLLHSPFFCLRMTRMHDISEQMEYMNLVKKSILLMEGLFFFILGYLSSFDEGFISLLL